MHLFLHGRSRGVLRGLKVPSLVRTCVFCRPKLSNTEKNRPSLGKCVRYLNASERSYLTFLQNTMDYGVLSYH